MRVAQKTPDEVLVTIPGNLQQFLDQVCKAKGLTREQAASLMVFFACRLLQESPMQPDADFLVELDFARAFRLQTGRRADQLLGLEDRLLLDSQGVHRAQRNRTIAAS
jgi:hypothetical protein